MTRKDLFPLVDEELDKVCTIEGYNSLLALLKMLHKQEVLYLDKSGTSFKTATSILIDFVSKTGLLNYDTLIKNMPIGKKIKSTEISYIEIYDMIKETLLMSETDKNIKPFLFGMLDGLISVYLDRYNINFDAIKEKYNDELVKARKRTKEMYLANGTKEGRPFSQENAIGFVHIVLSACGDASYSSNGLIIPLKKNPDQSTISSYEDASYSSDRLSELLTNNIEQSTINSFIESLSYFASITFYNKCRDNFNGALNDFIEIYKVIYPINNIKDMIPILIRMNFPIKETEDGIEINFEELKHQIDTMKKSLKDKTLIIR